ncbi:hypothetical protein DEO72_LG3g1639 [Vigna unguiculata]|uniref:Uncharacterized protein n=1 Tax=Vigna unguiculata TaxID=3917 RepID=A0A4D6LEW4_VIGUN|nr:hypothetical protein DEO72_LG3g1639 [Vigna unguiculata]
MPRFSNNQGSSETICLDPAPTRGTFTFSGQPSSSPTTSATVSHNSHRTAHLRRSRPAFRRLHRTVLLRRPAQLYATVPHISHRPAHLRRTAPTIPHTSDASGHRFVACTAPPQLLLLLLRPTTTVAAPSRSRALPPEPLRVLRATITNGHCDSVQSACHCTHLEEVLPVPLPLPPFNPPLLSMFIFTISIVFGFAWI